MKLLAVIVISLSLLPLGCANESRGGIASVSGAPQAAASDDSQTMKIMRGGSQPSQEAPAEYFTGSVRVDPSRRTIRHERLAPASRSNPVPVLHGIPIRSARP